MEIIRSKRATSTAGGGGAPGQPKSKYRKRSVRVSIVYFAWSLIVTYAYLLITARIPSWEVPFL
jgi:hypothetical protein